MKNLVLNNYSWKYEAEDDFKKYVFDRFGSEKEIWEHFQNSYWPQNREETLNRFFSLKSGDNIITAHTFVDFQQLEIMVEILTDKRMSKGLNIHIWNPSLEENIQEFFDKHESSITPNTQEYNDSCQLREEFKQQMNEKVKQCFEIHNVYKFYLRDAKKLTISDFNFR